MEINNQIIEDLKIDIADKKVVVDQAYTAMLDASEWFRLQSQQLEELQQLLEVKLEA